MVKNKIPPGHKPETGLFFGPWHLLLDDKEFAISEVIDLNLIFYLKSEFINGLSTPIIIKLLNND